MQHFDGISFSHAAFKAQDSILYRSCHLKMTMAWRRQLRVILELYSKIYWILCWTRGIIADKISMPPRIAKFHSMYILQLTINDYAICEFPFIPYLRNTQQCLLINEWVSEIIFRCYSIGICEFLNFGPRR